MSINLPSVSIIPISGIPMIQAGDDLAAIILDALKQAGISLQSGDVLVITSKIVSKAEGRLVDLQTVRPGEQAIQLAEATHKDPRIVELILRESCYISRQKPGTLIVQHRLGFISASAGIDQSNVRGSDEFVLLIPENPDATAESLRACFQAAAGATVGVIISDSHGRPFRLGNVGVAIGVAGMPALVDLRGQPDLFGRDLHITIQGYADMVASAALLVIGESNEGLPVALLRGLRFPPIEGHASDLYRPVEQDMYR